MKYGKVNSITPPKLSHEIQMFFVKDDMFIGDELEFTNGPWLHECWGYPRYRRNVSRKDYAFAIAEIPAAKPL